MDKNMTDMMELVISELRETRNDFKTFKEKIENELQMLKDDFAKYEDNYRPTHKNKIDINAYIKERLGNSLEDKEVEKVKKRALMMFEADTWQEIPVAELVSPRGMAIIDDSILSTIKFRTTEQVSFLDTTSKVTSLGRITIPNAMDTNYQFPSL